MACNSWAVFASDELLGVCARMAVGPDRGHWWRQPHHRHRQPHTQRRVLLQGRSDRHGLGGVSNISHLRACTCQLVEATAPWIPAASHQRRVLLQGQPADGPPHTVEEFGLWQLRVYMSRQADCCWPCLGCVRVALRTRTSARAAVRRCPTRGLASVAARCTARHAASRSRPPPPSPPPSPPQVPPGTLPGRAHWQPLASSIPPPLHLLPDPGHGPHWSKSR